MCIKSFLYVLDNLDIFANAVGLTFKNRRKKRGKRSPSLPIKHQKCGICEEHTDVAAEQRGRSTVGGQQGPPDEPEVQGARGGAGGPATDPARRYGQDHGGEDGPGGRHGHTAGREPAAATAADGEERLSG